MTPAVVQNAGYSAGAGSSAWNGPGTACIQTMSLTGTTGNALFVTLRNTYTPITSVITSSGQTLQLDYADSTNGLYYYSTGSAGITGSPTSFTVSFATAYSLQWIEYEEVSGAGTVGYVGHTYNASVSGTNISLPFTTVSSSAYVRANAVFSSGVTVTGGVTSGYAYDVSAGANVFDLASSSPLTAGAHTVGFTLSASNTGVSNILEYSIGSSTPSVTIDDETCTNLDGTVNVVLHFSPAAVGGETLHYATADNTATAGLYYTAASGNLTLTPGQTTATVSIPILP